MGKVEWNYHAPSDSQLWGGNGSIPGRVHSWQHTAGGAKHLW